MEIHSQENRWRRKQQPGIIVRVWEWKCGLGEEIREERTGISVRRQMKECYFREAVGGGKGNGNNVFMHKGWSIIRKLLLLSTAGPTRLRQRASLPHCERRGYTLLQQAFYS